MVAPFQHQAAGWANQLAQLRAAAAHGDDVALQAAAFVPLIAAARVDFEAAVASSSVVVARHTLVTQVAEVLERLLASFEELGEGRGQSISSRQ